MTNHAVKLHGRIILTATIVLKTGLHIGGSGGGLDIGGVDKPVIRNQFTNRPYIPGSSLKGKMRSLTEKVHMAPQTQKINTIFIHTPRNQTEYEKYPVASIFGALPEYKASNDKTVDPFTVPTPTRLIVRDVHLTDTSEALLRTLTTDLPYTEVKWEAAIDRVTSAATPRQIERVPAGAKFGPAEIIFSVYSRPDEPAADVAALFRHVVEALQYLEDDYLGGMGTRGSGQIAFEGIAIQAKRMGENGYAAPQDYDLTDAEQIIHAIDLNKLEHWLRDTFPAGDADA